MVSGCWRGQPEVGVLAGTRSRSKPLLAAVAAASLWLWVAELSAPYRSSRPPPSVPVASTFLSSEDTFCIGLGYDQCNVILTHDICNDPVSK